jgi:hypothetical protein
MVAGGGWLTQEDTDAAHTVLAAGDRSTGMPAREALRI